LSSSKVLWSSPVLPPAYNLRQADLHGMWRHLLGMFRHRICLWSRLSDFKNTFLFLEYTNFLFVFNKNNATTSSKSSIFSSMTVDRVRLLHWWSRMIEARWRSMVNYFSNRFGNPDYISTVLRILDFGQFFYDIMLN
jgi:hypothetical protein